MYRFELTESNKRNTIEIELNLVSDNSEFPQIIYFNIDDSWKSKLISLINTFKHFNDTNESIKNTLYLKEIDENLYIANAYYIEIAFITYYDNECKAFEVKFSSISDSIDSF